MTPAEQLAHWADRLRDLAGAGLKYAGNIFTFLCRALDEGAAPREAPSHALETAELGWFGERELPDNLFIGHVRRIADAFRMWRGEPAAHFD
jgi:hypothetical protein